MSEGKQKKKNWLLVLKIHGSVSMWLSFIQENNFVASFYNTAENKLEEEKLSQILSLQSPIYLTKSAVDQLKLYEAPLTKP